MKKINLKTVISIAVVLVILVLAAVVLRLSNQVLTDSSYPLKYQEEIEAASKKYGVDEALIYGVIKTESNFDPNAKSTVGAIGLMQIMPETFEDIQTRFEKDETHKFEDLYDPALNIDYGVEYLSSLLKELPSEEAAVCAYNGGIVNVRKWLADPEYSEDGKTFKEVPFPETDNYRRLVAQNKSIYKKLYFS